MTLSVILLNTMKVNLTMVIDMCILFHKWGKWEVYVERGTFFPGILHPKEVQGKRFRYSETRQKRVCQKCGRMEYEIIKDGE